MAFLKALKMEKQAVHCVPKGFKHLIDDLGGCLLSKKRDCLDQNQNSFSKPICGSS